MANATPQFISKYSNGLWGGRPPTAAQMGAFLGQDRVRVFAKQGPRTMGTWFWESDEVDQLNEDGWDVYVVLNPTKPSFTGVKPADWQIEKSRFTLVDYDLVEDEITPDAESTFHNFTMFYDSALCFWTGRGIQRWYEWDQPETDAIAAKYYSKQLIKTCIIHWTGKGSNYFHVDPCTTDLSRLARWPNTINWKTGYRGCVLQWGSSVVYRSEYGSPPVESEKTAGVLYKGLQNLSSIAPRLNGISSRFLLEGIDSAQESRHKAANATAHCLREIGLDAERAIELVLGGAAICTKHGKPYPLPEDEARHCVRTAYKLGPKS